VKDETIPPTNSLEQAEHPGGGFFAIDQATWARVCGLGLNAAVAYLVLARGTGKDHRTTAWSANAVESKTGIGWRRAYTAIKTLQSHQLVEPLRGGSRPMYGLTLPESAASWIWLPNTIVDGIEGVTAPVERIRQIGDVMTLRLFVHLYGAHGLREDGGIARSVTYQSFERFDVGQYAEYGVFGFAPSSQYVVWGSPGLTPASDLFPRFRHLQTLGLIEWVPTLYEHPGPDAEAIHPLHTGSSIAIEADLAEAADRAGRALVTEGQLRWADEQGCVLVIPVLRHLENVAMIGVARLTYRAQTRATSMWWSMLHAEGIAHRQQYEALAKRAGNLSRLRAG
jgi:hypothetical protein